MSFRVTGLDPAPFRHLFGLSDAVLAAQGVKRYLVNSKPGFPDRVEVRDMEVGETALLLNYTHQPADTPYRASHAIFVREGADRAAEFIGEVPEVMRLRMISLRAFNEAGEMLDADLAEGGEIEPLILRFLGDPDVAYLHAHYAKRGCYAARIQRV
jgi:hypothetical protein